MRLLRGGYCRGGGGGLLDVVGGTAAWRLSHGGAARAYCQLE